MSFDVFLVRFRDGDGRPIDSNGKAVALALIQQLDCEHTPGESDYLVDFPDGSTLTLYADGLDSECGELKSVMFELRAFSKSVGDFVFDFAKATGCVVLPVAATSISIVPDRELVAHLATDFARDFPPMVVQDGQELLDAMRGDIDSWRAFRDRSREANQDECDDAE